MNYGLLTIVTVAGAVATALLWSMSVTDPYWRLVEAPNLPAPAYEGSNDLRAMLANVPLELGNTDAGAVNPVADPLAGVKHPVSLRDRDAGETEAASLPEPMNDPAPPFEPETMAGPAADAVIAYASPRAAVPVPTDFAAGTDLVVTRAPAPQPAPIPLRDSGAGKVASAASARTLDQFVVPATPAQPRIVASKETEEALALRHAARVDVQRRLALAGFDPRGLDGIFGPRTRGAITDFQTAWGFPATGYLEPSIYADLKRRTEGAYQALRRRAAAAPSAAPDLAPAASERQIASVGGRGKCARQSDGRIIERQSLACDIAGLGETFVSLGRNTLDYREDGAAAASAQFGATAGANR